MMKTNFEIAKIMITFYNNRDNGNYDIIFEILLLKSPQLSLHPHIYIVIHPDTRLMVPWVTFSIQFTICTTLTRDLVLNLVLMLWIRIDFIWIVMATKILRAPDLDTELFWVDNISSPIPWLIIANRRRICIILRYQLRPIWSNKISSYRKFRL